MIIYGDNVKFNPEGGGDAGVGFTAKCPDCKETIKVAEYQWWKSICGCGIQWHLNIIVKAEKSQQTKETTMKLKILHKNKNVSIVEGLLIKKGETVDVEIKNYNPRFISQTDKIKKMLESLEVASLIN